jgi:phenylacetate-CoA ligase
VINWRRPILNFYDRRIRSNAAYYASILHGFYALPGERRHQIQAERLSQLLLRSARTVPYYRELLAGSGVVLGDHVDLTRFRQVRQLTRDVLRSEFDRLTSGDLASRAWYENSSGGSSGEPVKVIQDRDYHLIGTATTQMHFAWAGRTIGEPFVRLWGSDRDVLYGTLGWRNQFSNFIRNQIFLNSFNMSIVNMQRYGQ